MRSFCILAALVVQVSLVETARADDADRARALFVLANDSVDQGRLEHAVALYRDAYALQASPEILANLAYVLEEQGRVAEAANTWTTLLEAHSAFARSVDAETRLGATASGLARIRFAALPGHVRIDDVAVSERARWVAPGQHVVALGSSNERIDVAAGDVRDVHFVLPPPRPPLHRRPYLWLGVASIALATTGAVLTRAADRAHADFELVVADPESHRFSEAHAAEERARTRTAWSRVTLGAAAISAVVGGYLVYRDYRDAPGARIIVDVGSEGGSVAIAGGL